MNKPREQPSATAVARQDQPESICPPVGGAGEPVAWRPKLQALDPIYRSRNWNDGSPTQNDIDYWTRNGQGIEYAYTHPSPAEPPKGWKLVLVEPTNHMRKMGHYAGSDPHHPGAKGNFPTVAACWDAMLAAAPEPPQGERGEKA